MPWWDQLDSNGKPTTTIQKAAKSPGKGWLLIAEAQDYLTHDEVEKLVAAYQKGQNPQGATGPETSAAHSTTEAAKRAASTVPEFLSRLESANTWLRVGEVLLGIILIAVGIAKMTKVVPLATDIAKVVK